MQSSAPIGIAGAGRLAQALGRLLRDAGESVVCLAGRDPARTRLAAAFAGAAPVSLAELPRRASRFLIAVSDQAIGEVAETLAGGGPAAAVAGHTSGAAGPGAPNQRTLNKKITKIKLNSKLPTIPLTTLQLITL